MTKGQPKCLGGAGRGGLEPEPARHCKVQCTHAPKLEWSRPLPPPGVGVVGVVEGWDCQCLLRNAQDRKKNTPGRENCAKFFKF